MLLAFIKIEMLIQHIEISVSNKMMVWFHFILCPCYSVITQKSNENTELRVIRLGLVVFLTVITMLSILYITCNKDTPKQSVPIVGLQNRTTSPCCLGSLYL